MDRAAFVTYLRFASVGFGERGHCLSRIAIASIFSIAGAARSFINPPAAASRFVLNRPGY